LVASTGGIVRLAAASSASRKDHHGDLMTVVAQLAADTALASDVRHEAAEVLRRFGAGAEAAKLLLAMARSADVPSHVREEAVLSLCNGGHAAELLAICEDLALPDWLRISGCDALTHLDDRRDFVRRPFFEKLRASCDGWLRQRMDAVAQEAAR